MPGVRISKKVLVEAFRRLEDLDFSTRSEAEQYVKTLEDVFDEEIRRYSLRVSHKVSERSVGLGNGKVATRYMINVFVDQIRGLL